MDLVLHRLQNSDFRLDDAGRGVAKPAGGEECLGTVEGDEVVVRAQLAGHLDARHSSEDDLVLQPSLHVFPLDGTVGCLACSHILCRKKNDWSRVLWHQENSFEKKEYITIIMQGIYFMQLDLVNTFY